MDKSHPVVKFFLNVGAGMKPSPAEIDELFRAVVDGTESLSVPSATLRSEVKEAVDRIAEHRSEGSMGAARDVARDTAAGLVDRLGTYTPPSSSNSEMDPKKLADMVRR
jgi:hypothetical protein